jgi:hypothetical protein
MKTLRHDRAHAQHVMRVFSSRVRPAHVLTPLGLVGAGVGIATIDSWPTVAVAILAGLVVAAFVGWLVMERRLDEEAGIR